MYKELDIILLTIVYLQAFVLRPFNRKCWLGIIIF